MAVRYLLMVSQSPLLDTTWLRYKYKKTVPVGRCLMRFPSPESVLSLMVVWELWLEFEEAAPIWEWDIYNWG